MERDPSKRRVRPSTNPEWIHLDDFYSESSSDSDFHIEDHSIFESDSDDASYLSFNDGLLNMFNLFFNP